MSLLYKIGQKPIIAALRDPANIQEAVSSQVDNIFFMGGKIQEVAQAVRIAKEAKKGAFVHLDLIRGLSSTDKETVDFIADYFGVDGIVTPKSHMIKEARRIGLYGILHLFVLDSLALENGLKMVNQINPDAIEIMPGTVPKVIAKFAETAENVPIIASGLIQTKPEAAQSLQAGATALSVSETSLWSCTFQDLIG